jgi:murein L,D-transpeptidase YafK
MYIKAFPIFTNGAQFSKCKNELIAHGFIEEIENGRTSRTKNVYAFSEKWKDWKPGDDFRPAHMKKKGQ